jgi:hypothetical protein
MVLSRVEWTSTSGAPVAVSLVQGNVTQDLKFDPEFRRTTFDLYTELVAASRGRLVVLPESAFPVFAQEVPEAVLLGLLDAVVPRDGDVLAGLFTMSPPLAQGDGPRYYNSVVSVGVARPQLYRKRHLVPFGEFVPYRRFVEKVVPQVDQIPRDEVPHRVDAIVDVHDAPPASQPLAVGTPVACATTVVDVNHGPTTAGPEQHARDADIFENELWIEQGKLHKLIWQNGNEQALESFQLPYDLPSEITAKL